MPLDLLGIIYSPRPGSSLATIKERGYSIADIYREGDGIIGQEQAMVYLVEPGRVVLNNNGSKECLEIKTVKVSDQEPRREGRE